MNNDIDKSRLNLIASEFGTDGKNRTSHNKGKLWIESYPDEIELYKNLLVHRNKRILDNATGGTNFLDIGCGFGDIIYMMRNKYKVLYGIDPSYDMVQQCINNLKIRSVENEYHIKQGIAEETGFDDNSFNTITLSDVYEHIHTSHRHKALSEVKRILRNDGQLILVTPSKLHILIYSIIDNILMIPLNIKNKNKISIFKPTQKDFTEFFCTKQQLYRDMNAAGFKILNFERVSFYPAPERPGFLGRRLIHLHNSKYYPLLKKTFAQLENISIFNQKMLLNCILK